MKKKLRIPHLGNQDGFRKILNIMKITCLFLLMGFMQLSASVYSQSTTLDIALRNATVSEVIETIQNQSEFKFLYEDQSIDINRKVSVHMSGKVEEILDEVFEGTTVKYTVMENNLIVLANPAVQDQGAVSGSVKSADGEPIIGANVVVKGTTNGAVTDLEGNFNLVVTAGAVLQVSFIGYVAQEIPVDGQSNIQVTLKEETIGIDDVVVIGYGTQKRSNMTGAISSVKAEDIEKLNVRRVDQALRGKAAGVMVNQNTGKPGAGPSIHVRGVGSIGDTSPLWIVDGIRMGTGNYFDIDDVESIEILKDASASAIYGAQAAHGVILVTTKRGLNNGKVNVNFKANVGQSAPINLPTMLNRDQFIDVATRSRVAAGQQPDPSWSEPGQPDTDWSDELFAGSGLEQSYNLDVSSGNEKATYYLSGGYDSQEGIMIDNKFERYSLRANSDYKLFKEKVKIGESILVSRTQENPTVQAEGVPWRSIPMNPLYDDTNPYGGWGRAPTYFQGSNVVAKEYQSHRKLTNNRLNANAYVDIEIIDGLHFKSTFGINYTSFLGEEFDEAYSYGSLTNTNNELRYKSNDSQTLTANYVLTYDKDFGDHSIKAMAGYESIKTDEVGFGASMQTFPIDVSWSFNLATGAPNVYDRSSISRRRILSQFGRVNYSYKDKYLLEATVRRDASAPKFGQENLWGVFPSWSVGWRITEEAFMQEVDWISNLKLRVSSGTLGSDNIGNYLYSKTYYSSRAYYAFDANGSNKVPGFFLNRFPNEAVKWEEITMTDVGIDLGLFDNKLSFVMDYYVKNTTDMLYSVPVPQSVGISRSREDPSSVSMNIGEMKNTGFELAVNYVETFNELKLSLNGNTSFMSNELTKLAEDAFINGGIGGQTFGSTARSEVGMPLSSFYGFEYVKIFDTQQEIDALNAAAPDGAYQNNKTAPGDMMYRDLNGDGEITNDDRTYIGNPWPKVIYGLTTNLEWRNFDMNIFFQGVAGVDVFNGNRGLYEQIFADYNTSTNALNAWEPNNMTGQPRLILSDPNGNFRNVSSYFVENGAYLKLRNLQIGYNLPKSILDRINMSKARIYVNGDNLLTITNYSGIDPEVSGDNTGRGVDFNAYPQVRTLSVGIELGL